MAKAIYLCYREENSCGEEIESRLTEICKEITPGNLAETPPEIRSYPQIYIGISNPVNTIQRNGASLLLGFLNKKNEDWHQIKTKAPDGTIVIIRADDDFIELVTDVTGSRSLWYYLDDEKLIASTSQIAITRYLKNFRLNKKVIPWMLSTGSLGPGNSWDERVMKVKPNSVVCLNRKSWKLRETSSAVKFLPEISDPDEGKRLLRKELHDLFRNLDYDEKKWLIPLSGGYDSRAILFFLKKFWPRKNFTTVTWGTKESEKRRGTDARIARELSEEIGVANLFYESNGARVDIESVLNRFIMCSEGTTDHIAAYMDGFELWNDLNKRGCAGIVRGEVPFASEPMRSDHRVREVVGLLLCSDHSRLKEVVTWGYEPQTIPPELQKCNGESRQSWLDRLYLEYRVPVVVSSLADAKFPYVEQSMPLFSDRMIHLFCRFTDELRVEKKVFKEVVKEMNIHTPIAKRSSNEALELILRNPEMVRLMKETLSEQQTLDFFPEEFIHSVTKNMKRYHRIFYRQYRFFFRLYNWVTPQVTSILKKQLSPQALSDNHIAFRMMLFMKMHKLLKNS